MIKQVQFFLKDGILGTHSILKHITSASTNWLLKSFGSNDNIDIEIKISKQSINFDGGRVRGMWEKRIVYNRYICNYIPGLLHTHACLFLSQYILFYFVPFCSNFVTFWLCWFLYSFVTFFLFRYFLFVLTFSYTHCSIL